MKEKDKPTSDAGQGGTKQPLEKELPKFKLKVVEDDPATGKPVHKEIEVTAEDAVKYAQQGYRAEDKNKNFNRRVKDEAKKVASTMIEPEVEARAQQLFESLKVEADTTTSKEEPLDPEDPDYLAKKVQRLETTLKSVQDVSKERTKLEANIATNVKLYKIGVKKAVIDYGVDENQLIEWIKETGIPPTRVGSLAKLINSFSKSGVDVDKVPDKDKGKLAEAIKDTLTAPPKGETGTTIEDKKEEIPTTREGLIDKALEKLEEWESASS